MHHMTILVLLMQQSCLHCKCMAFLQESVHPRQARIDKGSTYLSLKLLNSSNPLHLQRVILSAVTAVSLSIY